MASPTPAVYAARPLLEITGAGQPALEQGLQRLEIVETIHGLSRCEAEFINWGSGPQGLGFLYFDRALLDFGRAFAVKVGPDVLFTGRIMALEGGFPAGAPPLLTVLAEDLFQDLRMTRRTRTFENVSDADVIRRVASDHGLTADVHADGPTYKVLAQVNQSDLAFLRERARAIDAELWMQGATLHVASRAVRRGAALTLTMGRELRSFNVIADLATQRTSLAVNGWDVAAKTALHHEAGDDALQGELNGDLSGASILQSAFGERKEALAHTVPLNSSEAEAVAGAEFKNVARRFVRGNGTVDAQAALRVGAVLDLRELGPLFSGKYYVTGTRHLFDSKLGLRSEFTAERPGLGHP